MRVVSHKMKVVIDRQSDWEDVFDGSPPYSPLPSK